MYRAVDVVEVRIWDQTVGAVALDPRSGYYAFEFDPRFIRTGIDLAPLEMSTARGRGPFVFPDLPENTFRRLPAMLADALPDRFGNALITAYLERQGVRAGDITVLDRLAYMGKRGFGALEFRPSRGPRPTPKQTALELSELVEQARRAVAGKLSDPHAKAALMNLIRVGTSAGGARAKAAIAWNPETREVRAGQFEVAPGFEHWLLKFDGVGEDSELGISKHYGRIEYAYFLMARGAGIVISDCRLLEEGGRAHFMTRRFDRDGSQKHHLQTLCAMAHLDYNQRATHDYAQFFMTIDALGLGEAARAEAFRRVAFNVMARNHDDHAKNLSFVLHRGGVWELAPAYDLTHAYNPRGTWTYQHLMSVNGKFDDISRNDLLILGARFNVPGVTTLLGEVGESVAGWARHAAAAALPADETERVRRDLLLL